MSLPIILAIVLTTAILAWGAVYLVIRRQRIAAENRMFRSDPMDAEIGREALRRVFGILADEDPADVPPLAKTPLAPLLTVIPPAAQPGVVAQPSMAAADATPVVLGPAGAAPGSASRSASVAPAFAQPEPVKPTPVAPAPTPIEIAAAVPLVASVAAAATPAAPFVLAPAPAPVKFQPSSPPAPTPAAPSKGFRLFAPDNNGKAAAAAASPLLPAGAILSGAPGLPVPVGSTPKPNVPAKPASSGGGRRNTRGNQRPRFIRDSLGALLVTGGIVVVAVAILHPQLSLTGGVSPATATAPAIGQVSFVPLFTPSPSPTDTPSPTPSPSDSPSPSPSDSPSPSPSPSPTPVVTPVPTPRPTPIPPVPTPMPTPGPTHKPGPTPTPAPPIARSFTFTRTGLSVTFSGTYDNGTSWTIDSGDPNLPGPETHTGTGAVSWTHLYGFVGDYTVTLIIHKTIGKKTVDSTPWTLILHL